MEWVSKPPTETKKTCRAPWPSVARCSITFATARSWLASPVLSAPKAVVTAELPVPWMIGLSLTLALRADSDVACVAATISFASSAASSAARALVRAICCALGVAESPA